MTKAASAVGTEPDVGVADAKPREVEEVHTGILRLALGVEESRAYWEHVDPAVPPADRPTVAFEQRWFGAKSLQRAVYLVRAFVNRYDAFPDALTVLRRWPGMDLATRTVICHWHLQLADPIYRAFTGRYLVERRDRRDLKVDRHRVVRWVKDEHPDRWSDATCVQFGSKLLSAASEAGLISEKRDPRDLLVPKVSDVALAYLLYLLRGIRFSGTMTSNPYVASIGLDEAMLDQRLRSLPGITYSRMTHLTEFEWAAPDLVTWAEMTL